MGQEQSYSMRSPPLSLVQGPRDTVLSLVEPYNAGAKLYAITTHFKARMAPEGGLWLP